MPQFEVSFTDDRNLFIIQATSGSMGTNIFCGNYLVKNHEILNNSITTDAGESISITGILRILGSIDVRLTKFKTN
jgi:hypothetical protein